MPSNTASPDLNGKTPDRSKALHAGEEALTDNTSVGSWETTALVICNSKIAWGLFLHVTDDLPHIGKKSKVVSSQAMLFSCYKLTGLPQPIQSTLACF